MRRSTDERESADTLSRASDQRPAHQDKATVLVVDDDRAVRDSLRRHLKLAGYNVLTAEDAIQAITLFGERGADLVILDVKMPGMDGFEVCETIRKTDSVPIIILTGAQEPMLDQYLPQMVEATGGDHFMRKPCDIKKLLRLIDDLLLERSS